MDKIRLERNGRGLLLSLRQVTTGMELYVQKDNATNKFLGQINIENIDEVAKVRKKERCRRNKKTKTRNFSTLKLLEALPKVEEMAESIPVKLVKSDFYYKQRKSKKALKKMIRRERSKHRQHIKECQS